MSQQVAVASRTAGEGSVSKLAQFFPEAVAVRIPVRVTGTGGRGRELSEQTLIEYGTADEVLFASSLPLEFDDHLHLENADGSLRAEADIVALQYHDGRVAIAARFTAKTGELDHPGMSTAIASARLTEIAALWRLARQLYPVYAAVVRQYSIALEPSRDLEYPVDRSDPDAVERITTWLREAEGKIEVWQLRQVLQTSELGSERALHALISRILQQEKHSGSERDKLDFLLAQYFFHCAPTKMHQGEPSMDDVAQVLEPVIGEAMAATPSWLVPIDLVVNELRHCHSLRDLLDRNLLARARKLKVEAGEMYFGPSAMLTFTRFNFIVRGTFVRLIHADLHAIRFALHGLEQRGQNSFDCSAAGLGKNETSEYLRLYCHDWKTMFRASYSSGQPFQPLIKLRELLEAALAAPAPQITAPAPEPPAAQVVAKPAAPQRLVEDSKSPEPPPATPVPVEKVQPAAAAPSAMQEEVAAAYQRVSKPGVAKPAPERIAIGGKPAAAPAPTDVDGCLEQIAEQLLKDSARTGTAVTAVVVAGHKLMLSSWEVAAFVHGGDDVSDALQRAVGARALLSRAAQDRKQGIEVNVAPVLAAAHAEAAALQAQVAHAKEKKNIDGAVNLAASARRLIGLMEELERGTKPPRWSAQ